jgi:hypothetical protein
LVVVEVEAAGAVEGGHHQTILLAEPGEAFD